MTIECRACATPVIPQKKVKKKWVAFWVLLAWPVAIVYAMTVPATTCPRCEKHVYRG